MNRLNIWIDAIKSRAPEYLETFLKSPDLTLSLLGHERASVRTAAIVASHAIWNMGHESRFVKEACRILIHEVEDGPVMAVTEVLRLSFHNSQNRAIQSALAVVVLNSKALTYVRNNAYRAMLEVEYGRDETRSVLEGDFMTDLKAILSGGKVVLSNIDWDFVESKAY